MPSTARLLRADGSTKIHAHKPEQDITLCGLTVVDPDDENITPRSADFTGIRYYNGVSRLMCAKCNREAIRVRTVGTGSVGLPLALVRGA